MKNRKQGIVVLLIVFTLALAACDGNPSGGRDTDEDEGQVGGGDPGGVPSTLSGTITISPEGPLELGAVLSANYTGTETVSYQWKRGTENTGGDSNEYTTDKSGSYTVTVSADGFVSKTSDAVIVMSHPIIVEEGSTLREKLTWISLNGDSYSTYVIVLSADEIQQTMWLSYPGNITIIFNGGEEERFLLWKLTVSDSITMILDNNITLHGHPEGIGGAEPMVRVNSGGTFEMREGSKIIDGGNGVYVANNGTFTMYGGTISGNKANNGGGVYVNGGTFTMNGGEISGNKCNSGGGVYVNEGTFIMNGGKITGNTNDLTNAANTFGGGVHVAENGTFTMNGGEISNNKTNKGGGGVFGSFTMNGGTICDNIVSAGDGGGVYVYSYRGTFIMTGGTICGNTATSINNDSKGGGVFLPQSAAFTMTGGEISGYNRAWYGGGVNNEWGTFTMTDGKISGNGGITDGGGVYILGGTNTMDGGEISGNTASRHGGGLYVRTTTFTMTGGVISGNKTTATSSSESPGGGGVYVAPSYNVSVKNIFRIVTGTVYGEDGGDLSNTVGYIIMGSIANGAAILGDAERGTFSGETWIKTGSLNGSNTTVRVVNGELVDM